MTAAREELEQLAGRVEAQAISQLRDRTTRDGWPDLDWEDAKGIAAVFACAASLRARAAMESTNG